MQLYEKLTKESLGIHINSSFAQYSFFETFCIQNKYKKSIVFEIENVLKSIPLTSKTQQMRLGLLMLSPSISEALPSPEDARIVTKLDMVEKSNDTTYKIKVNISCRNSIFQHEKCSMRK